MSRSINEPDPSEVTEIYSWPGQRIDPRIASGEVRLANQSEIDALMEREEEPGEEGEDLWRGDGDDAKVEFSTLSATPSLSPSEYTTKELGEFLTQSNAHKSIEGLEADINSLLTLIEENEAKREQSVATSLDKITTTLEQLMSQYQDQYEILRQLMQAGYQPQPQQQMQEAPNFENYVDPTHAAAYHATQQQQLSKVAPTPFVDEFGRVVEYAPNLQMPESGEGVGGGAEGMNPQRTFTKSTIGQSPSGKSMRNHMDDGEGEEPTSPAVKEAWAVLLNEIARMELAGALLYLFYSTLLPEPSHVELFKEFYQESILHFEKNQEFILILGQKKCLAMHPNLEAMQVPPIPLELRQIPDAAFGKMLEIEMQTVELYKELGSLVSGKDWALENFALTKVEDEMRHVLYLQKLAGVI